MCTLMTLHNSKWSTKMENRIRKDAIENPDGFALLLMTSDGAHSIFRTFDIDAVVMLLNTVTWSRMFLHCRYATQGAVTLDNSHGWSNQGVFYMHNGRLAAPEARLFPVDSQAIGDWLESGIDTALKDLWAEPYANVFLINTVENYYVVNRSLGGQLYTDGRGNYSTNRVGNIRKPVRRRSQKSHIMYVVKPEPKVSMWASYSEEDTGLGARPDFGYAKHRSLWGA